MNSTTTVSSLKYTRTLPFDCSDWGYKTPGSIKIRVELNDECKNGHEDFAITAEINHPRVRGGLASGCLHEEILKAAPDLAPFVALHLSDWQGAPMYAVANGYFHMQEGKRDILISHLRCTPEEADKLMAEARSQNEFAVMVEKMKLPSRWKKEADAAIAKLQELSGGAVFESKATRSNFSPVSPEVRADVKAKRKSGYYEPEQVKARDEAARLAKTEKAVAAIEADHAAKVRKLEDEKLVALYFVKRGYNRYDANVIWYSHTRELCFNWKQGHGAGKVWTQEDFVDFVNTCDRSELPAGLNFKIQG